MTIEDQINTYLPAAQTIADVALSIARVMPGASSVVGAIELGIKVANGVANEVPVIMQTWNDIQIAAAGGQPVSDADWVAWLSQVNDAHTAYLAAAARIEAQ